MLSLGNHNALKIWSLVHLCQQEAQSKGVVVEKTLEVRENLHPLHLKNHLSDLSPPALTTDQNQPAIFS
jgi:hypothetical protein